MIGAARRLSYAGSVEGRGAKALVRSIEWATATPGLLWRLRSIAADPPKDGLSLNRAFLGALRIETDLRGATIPAEGPLVVVANHPHGVADGMAMLEALSRLREDVRVLASALAPDLDVLLPVPYSHASDRAGGLRALEAALAMHLGARGAVIAFPAGRIAAPDEATWSPYIFRAARAAGAQVVPVHIAGGNSALHHLAARSAPVLRQGLLLRELARLSGRTIHLTAGPARPAQGRTDATPLRAETLALGTTGPITG